MMLRVTWQPEYPGPPYPAPNAVPARSTPARAASVSAGLLAAAFVVQALANAAFRFVPALSETPAVNNTLSIGVSLLLDVGFVVVAYLRAITAGKRTAALIAGLIATAIDVGSLALIMYVPALADSVALGWLNGSTTILFVAVWGIARRRNPLWLVGLVPALIVSILVAYSYRTGWVYETFGDGDGGGVAWLVYAVVWFGAVALGCAACWGFDAVGGSSTPEQSLAGGVGAPASYGSAGPAFGQPAYGQPAPTNSLAIAALVSSLLLAPLGIVFGHVALGQIKRTGEAGKGLAIAGLAIGYVGTVLSVLCLIFVMVVVSSITSGVH
jgi:Domain of unknown function (DUF4190)